MTSGTFHSRVVQSERGVALPVALLGLIAVSLLVTTAVVTASTESAISTAHQDATQALYRADGGLQAFVAEYGSVLGPGSTATQYVPAGGSASDAVLITPVHLADRPLTAGRTLRLFSVSSRSLVGGNREVVSMVRQIIHPAVPLQTNINSAITLGGDLHVNGNAFTVSGQNDACDPSGGVQAVMAADSSKVTISTNEKHIDQRFLGVDENGNDRTGRDAIVTTDLDKHELFRQTLGLSEGQTLQDLVSRIPLRKKWGPRFALNGQSPRRFSGYVGPADTVAVVDGDGGDVNVLGGSGLLIIVNGNLRMTGNPQFTGIIITEGNFTLSGNPTVTGAIISLGDDENIIDLDESAIGNGRVTVQYDACAIQAAEEAFGNIADSGIPPTVEATVAWMEVVR